MLLIGVIAFSAVIVLNYSPFKKIIYFTGVTVYGEILAATIILFKPVDKFPNL